jgi:tripartite-type tricarboxylate transporter receptor subunit TctC
MFRTNLLRGSALAAMLALSSVSAFAEQLSIVTPFPPGGISDSMARVVASYLSEELGETVIVDPQPGASGLVAARHVLNQEADGTVLFQTSPTVMMILPRTNKLEFNPREAFQTVSNVGSNQLVFAVRKDYPADTLAEFIDHVSKQEPGSLSLASPSSSSPKPALISPTCPIAAADQLCRTSWLATSMPISATLPKSWLRLKAATSRSSPLRAMSA